MTSSIIQPPTFPTPITRTGKIARLPRDIRQELNSRLDNGEPGKDLVVWLNALDPVKAALSRYFDGRPINEQNLSAWKLGGFREWQRRKEAQLRLIPHTSLSRSNQIQPESSLNPTKSS